MQEIFNVEPRIWMQKTPEFGNTKWDKRLDSIDKLTEGRNGGLFYPRICALTLNKIFNNFAVSKNKRVTYEIIKSNKDFKADLIRAFYDDEGGISNYCKNIRLHQDNKIILNHFRLLLKEFDIKAGEIKSYIKMNKKRYYFDIHRKSNFIKFKYYIRFTSIIKKDRLEKAVIIKNLKNSK
jgi:hypothetical protein